MQTDRQRGADRTYLMHVTSLVLLQMSFSAERDGAIDASEGSLEIVDVGVKTKLMDKTKAPH